VTVPVWNERTRIEACVSQLVTVSRQMPPEADLQLRIVVTEDGSTDGTKELLAGLSTRFPELIVCSSPSRKGRGRALRDLWANSDYDIVAYIDADLAMGTGPLLQCIREVQAGADLAMGCRYAPQSTVNRPPLVWFVSKGYNWLVRAVFHDGVLDHQCGLKALSANARRTVLPLTRDGAWFWDSELIVRCHRSGLIIKEIPLNWVEKKNPRTSVKRLVRETFSFTAAIVRFDPSPPQLAALPMELTTGADARTGSVSYLNANR
jgi:glycosyltransferase involved in cell wall biosynthesis